MPYDRFTCGLTFKTARRDIIAIGTDRKTGKTKYGRRNGTLGFMHEQKLMHWDQHVGECSDVVASGICNRVRLPKRPHRGPIIGEPWWCGLPIGHDGDCVDARAILNDEDRRAS